MILSGNAAMQTFDKILCFLFTVAFAYQLYEIYSAGYDMTGAALNHSVFALGRDKPVKLVQEAADLMYHGDPRDIRVI